MSKIVARLLKGFRDFNPKEEEQRLLCIQTLQRVFVSFGFVPIDTPILEYKEVLLGKGGGETDKQVYEFEDHGKRQVAMRFDLTIPFARYLSMNRKNLALPFSRFHIGKVFRGENTQRGRYREFIQCDFDTVGSDEVSSDFTIIQTIIAAFRALKIEKIKVHISHRGMFNEFLLALKTKTGQPSSQDSRGAAKPEKPAPEEPDPEEPAQKKADPDQDRGQVLVETLRIIDKIRKIGSEETLALLGKLWNSEEAKAIINFGICEKENTHTLQKLEALLPKDSSGLKRLRALYNMAISLKLEKNIVIDPSITRGLDYYTGFVCETFVTGFEDLGSVCSGGRYNTLTQMFDDELALGVGASIGLDRLLNVLDLAREQPLQNKIPKIVIMSQSEDCLAYCHSLLEPFQAHNIIVSIYPFCDNLKSFFKYVEKVEANFAIIIGTKELENKTLTIKNQNTREQLSEIGIPEAIRWIKNSE